MSSKVIYIMGAGRSGSTVLDILLGSNPDMLSTGELVHLHDRGWQDNNYCACGTRVNECEFWTSIREQWEAQTGLTVEQYLILQRRYERVRYVFFPGKLENDLGFHEYRRATKALIECVLQQSGKTVVIDSSKKHVRAFFLSTIKDCDLSVIHLVRDPRGFVWSKTKHLPKDEQAGVQGDQVPNSLMPMAFRWLSANMVCGVVRRRLKSRSIRVRYEDFVRNPEQELDRIALHCAVDLSRSKELLQQRAPIVAGHTVAGNRLRMKRNIVLKLDEEWKSKLTPFGKFTIGALSAPLLLLYGYLTPFASASASSRSASTVKE